MTWKKLAWVAVIAFLLYFLVRSPVESAEAIQNMWDGIASFASTLATSLTTFIQTLF